jgi:hypothetical protein
MSIMFEVVYRMPQDPDRERRIRECVSKFGGEITYWEGHVGRWRDQVCLTIEFPTLEAAEAAAARVTESGERIEGPLQDYPDD